MNNITIINKALFRWALSSLVLAVLFTGCKKDEIISPEP